MQEKLTLVVGASPNPERYSYKAVALLNEYQQPVIPLGIRKGDINGIEIIQGKPMLENIHTISLYLGPERQKAYYDYLLSLNPKRIIFNPGTENPVFYEMAQANDVELIEHCTLVMLNSGMF